MSEEGEVLICIPLLTVQTDANHGALSEPSAQTPLQNHAVSTTGLDSHAGKIFSIEGN